jgi:hypothetical protein
MKFKTNNLLIKFLFVTIWFFFIFRLSTYINPSINIIQFNEKNWVNFLNDCLSIIIIVGLFNYFLIYLITKKKISYIIILIIYPIFGLIGTLINYELHTHNPLIWHQFITLTSVFLFFSIIESNKIFDYQFKELLLKIILLFLFIFLLFAIAPKLYFNLTTAENIRGDDLNRFSLFNNKIYFEQNVNGLSRILFILQIFSLFQFKKFILNKKIIGHFFFVISLFLATIIYLIQSRFNIFASFIFSFFLIINIKNLLLIKKIIYFLIIIIFPIFLFNQNSNITNRFLVNNILTASLINTVDISDSLENLKDILNKDILNKDILNKDILNKDILNDEALNKYSRIKKYILIFDNELKKIDVTDNNLKNSKFLYSIIAIINIEIKKIEAENNIDETKIKSELIMESKRLVNNFNRIILANCSPSLNFLDGLFTGRICGWEILLKNIQINDLFFGKGYFADQIYLKNIQKISSNSWINILFNTGIISLFVCITFIIFILFRFFNFKNINHENIYLSISHYFFLYFIARSLLEDTIAFVGIDFLMFCICLLLITESKKKIP